MRYPPQVQLRLERANKVNSEHSRFSPIDRLPLPHAQALPKRSARREGSFNIFFEVDKAIPRRLIAQRVAPFLTCLVE